MTVGIEHRPLAIDVGELVGDRFPSFSSSSATPSSSSSLATQAGWVRKRERGTPTPNAAAGGSPTTTRMRTEGP